MRTQLLTDEMQEHFTELDRLAQRHREALEYSAASERMAFLHERLQTLHRALVELRLAVDLMHLLGGKSADSRIWQQTCADLQRRAPTDILAPGGAIVAGGVDLLRLVDYTGSSVALVSERRDRLIGIIAEQVAARRQALGIGETSPETSMPAIEMIRQMVTRVADSDGALSLDSIARELGWIDELLG